MLGSSGFSTRPDVDDREFYERSEREYEARRHPDINRLHIGHPRQLITWPSWLCSQRENGEKAEVDARHDGVDADPEGHPRQDDKQDTGDVVLD